jgi:hypothetical protein
MQKAAAKQQSTNNIIQTEIREFSPKRNGNGDEHPNTS